MAIFRKNDIKLEVEQFKFRAKKLDTILNGTKPNQSIYDQYHNNSDQYQKEFIEIDIGQLEYAIEDFLTGIKKLKTLHKKSAKKLGK